MSTLYHINLVLKARNVTLAMNSNAKAHEFKMYFSLSININLFHVF